MKVISQRTGFDCGPVAIRNAMVLLGRKPIGVKRLRRICMTDRHGTTSVGLRRGIRAARLCFYKTPGWLPLGKYTLIFGYKAGKEGHYCVISFDGKKYLAYNWAPDATIEHESHRNLNVTERISKAWLIKKLKQPDTEAYVL